MDNLLRQKVYRDDLVVLLTGKVDGEFRVFVPGQRGDLGHSPEEGESPSAFHLLHRFLRGVPLLLGGQLEMSARMITAGRASSSGKRIR